MKEGGGMKQGVERRRGGGEFSYIKFIGHKRKVFRIWKEKPGQKTGAFGDGGMKKIEKRGKRKE